MLKRILGKSGIEISGLGMGCWAIGGRWSWAQPGEEPFPAGWGKTDDNESIKAIHAGLDAGVTFFDTAANYGAGCKPTMLIFTSCTRGAMIQSSRLSYVAYWRILSRRAKFAGTDGAPTWLTGRASLRMGNTAPRSNFA